MNRLIRLPEVIRKVGLSKSTIYRMSKDGTFPDKVSLGDRAVAWPESTIDNWIENRITKTDIVIK